MPAEQHQTHLRWIASLPASALHAAGAILAGRNLTDKNLAEPLNGPALNLAAAIEHCGAQPQDLLPHLIGLAGGIPEPRQLSEVALTKLMPRDKAHAVFGPLADAVRQLVAAFQHAVPGVVDQLELRSQPLRSQWEARGPGLVATLPRFIDAEFIVSQADVILVFPVLGGGGSAHVPYNAVYIEAVLADPIVGLPEVTRLGWLLGQLNCDLARFQGELTRQQLELTAELAMIPAVLTAADEVELARCDTTTIKLAIDSWLANRERLKPDVVAILQDWWTTYLNTRTHWHVALAALAQMLNGRSAACSSSERDKRIESC